jgi:hypothetical protein
LRLDPPAFVAGSRYWDATAGEVLVHVVLVDAVDGMLLGVMV